MHPPPIPEAAKVALSPPDESPEAPRPRKKPPRVRTRHQRRGERCLNCGHGMEHTDHYCSNCGQENVDVNISIWHIGKEAFDEFLRLDSKMACTLWLLIRRPGELTLEWSKGRRVRYLSPLRLYLTITFFFFLVLPYLHPASHFLPEADRTAASHPAVRTIGHTESGFLAPFERLTNAVQDPAGRLAFVGHFLGNVSTAIFLMLPVVAGALWVLHARNGRYYVEHLVFMLHCHAYLFLLMFGAVLIPSRHGSLSPWGFLAVAVIMPIYILLALKRNYGQGWLKTIVKMAMLSYAYVIVLSLALLGAVIAAAAAGP